VCWLGEYIGGLYVRHNTYYVVSAVFLAASLVLGFALAARLRRAGLRRAWMWLFVQGAIAWSIALWTLAMLNFAPLCIGQDNGMGPTTWVCASCTASLPQPCTRGLTWPCLRRAQSVAACSSSRA